MTELTMVEAINRALRDEMQADEDVVLLGEDVGVDGGIFRATVDLIEEFGEGRVMDTPLAEVRHPRLLDRHGDPRPQARSGDAVLGLQLSRLPPDRIPRVAHAMALPGTVHGADGGAHALWQRRARARAPFGEPRGLLRAHAGGEAGRPVRPPQRARPADRGNSRPRPGRILRAQGGLPRLSRRGSRRARDDGDRQGRGRPRGRRPDHDRLRSDVDADARRRRDALGRRRRRGDRDRPPDLVAARPRADRRTRSPGPAAP